MTAPVSSSARYEELLELGRGGMGSAHLARARGEGDFERLVVVKRLLPHLLEEKEAVDRFLTEARIASRLHHANIVGVHHSGRDERGYFIVYDYVEGAALDELENWSGIKSEQLPPPIVLRIILDAACGLHAAHQAKADDGTPLNILHRDISPQNLLVGRDGSTRVLDFGIAKSALATFSTDKSYLVGKLTYTPPEYLSRSPLGPQFDVYSLGITLWVLLAGRMPWEEDSSEGQLVVDITQRGVPSLSSVGVHVAPALEALVARACAIDPAHRFPTAAALADELERLGRETGWLATHREVAALVERYCGTDLDQRRGRILRLSHAPAPPPSMPRDSPPPFAQEYTDGSATLETPYAPPTQSRLPQLVVLATLGLGLVGGVWTWSSSTQVAAVSRATTSEPPRTAVETNKSAPDLVVATPHSPAAESAAASSSADTSPAPVAKSATRVEKHPHVAPPAPAVPTIPATRPTRGIRTSNPYRKSP